VPAGLSTRPTPDRVREALFNILGRSVLDSRFLDLFAGSGAVGIEALSRGAASVALVESGRDALRALEKNVAALGLAGRAHVVAAPWPRSLPRAAAVAGPFTIVFADPPFLEARYEAILRSLCATGILGPDPTVILEHESRTAIPDRTADLMRFRVVEYGRVALGFFRRSE